MAVVVNTTKPSVLLTFGKVQNPLCLPRKTTSQRPKVPPYPTLSFFPLLTLKCASRHNSVHTFDISTSKSGPNMVCFVHFDLEMRFAPQWCALFDISTSKSGLNMVRFAHFELETRFAPQRCALFRHLHFQKWSKHGVLCTF